MIFLYNYILLDTLSVVRTVDIAVVGIRTVVSAAVVAGKLSGVCVVGAIAKIVKKY